MRNLIIITSAVFVAIVVASYFYFSNLEQNERYKRRTRETAESGTTEADNMAAGERQTQAALLWTFDLAAKQVSKPILCLYDDTSRFILVQDAYHILHAISARGDKLWNAQLPGAIVGGIQQLDDRSLVFTTAERLYRIDTEGDPLPGFSLQLPQEAIHGAVASYEAREAVRIDVQTKKRVLSYDGRGGQLRSRTGRTADASNAAEQDSSLQQQLANAALPPGVPADCGPLSYYGPLREGNGNYLICNKGDQTLYCYRY